jgi:hypothetical protein
MINESAPQRLKMCICYRKDGIGKRLIHLVEVTKMARLLDVPLIVLWRTNAANFIYPSKLGDILDERYYDYINIEGAFKSPKRGIHLASFLRNAGILTLQDPILTESERILKPFDVKTINELEQLNECKYFEPKKFDFDIEEVKSNYDVLFMGGYDGQWVPIPKSSINTNTTQATIIKPKPSIVEQARIYVENNSIREAIGVHIRRGDRVIDDKLSNMLATTDSYYRYIDGISETNRIYLATDSKEIEEEFKTKYGSRMIPRGELSVGYDTTEQIVDSMREIMIMSEAEEVLLCCSGFSNMVGLLKKEKDKIVFMHTERTKPYKIFI